MTHGNEEYHLVVMTLMIEVVAAAICHYNHCFHVEMMGWEIEHFPVEHQFWEEHRAEYQIQMVHWAIEVA